jgi:hypothetical protein
MAFKQPSTIDEALEALTLLAELQEEEPDDLLVEGSPVRQWTVSWLQDHDADETTLLVRRLFTIISSNIRELAGEKQPSAQKKKRWEALRRTLTRLSQTAAKLDRVYQQLQGTQPGFITGSLEYREVQQVYDSFTPRKRMAPVKPPALEAVIPPHVEEMNGLQQILADLDYELCYLRRDDGTPFLTEALRNSVELAADFGMDFESFAGDDPFVWTLSWKDQLLHHKARAILKGAWQQAQLFYRSRGQAKRGDLADALSAAMMALMMAARPSNLLVEFAKKPVYRYFADFQTFLRQALGTREFRSLAGQSPQASWTSAQQSLARALCLQLYQTPWSESEATAAASRLIADEQLPPSREESQIAERLRADHEALTTALGRHPSGPLFKMFDLVREESIPPFDPLLEGNIPGSLEPIHFDNVRTFLLRLPSPTRQSVLSMPVVDDEFIDFVRPAVNRGGRAGHLVLNLQNRLDWREQPRALALERLQENVELAHSLTVVTLGSNTSFYWEAGGFEPQEAALFFSLFETELSDSAGGYHFPDFVKQALFPAFYAEAVHAIHQLFFGGASTLSLAERQTFIDLFHSLLTIKLLDLYRPTDFCYVCKDGVDQSAAAAAAFMAVLWLLRQTPIGEAERAKLRNWIQAPALLFRERSMQPHVHERMVRAIQRVEQGVSHLGQAGQAHRLAEELEPLFHASWWKLPA